MLSGFVVRYWGEGVISLPDFSEREEKKMGDNGLLFMYFRGKKWVKKPFWYVSQQVINLNNQFIGNGQVSLLGTYPMILYYMTRTTILNATLVDQTATRRFLFKLKNSRADEVYSSGGNNSTQDLVLDNLIFGTGQFPIVLNPPIPFEPNGSIQYEIQDLGDGTANPYTIYFGFRGWLLMPEADRGRLGWGS